MAGAVAAGLTGLLVQPLALRLARSADRLFYGDRADPYVVSAALSARLSQGLDLTDVPLAVCETVVSGLRLGSAQLLLDDGQDRVLASAGDPVGEARRFPLHHRGDRVGWLAVTPRAGEREVGPRDAELLATLADQAGPAVAALRLHDRLQHSREALVAAREEERRRLRRDLHDGLGATLAGVRLQLESAQALLGATVAAPLLDTAGAGITHAIADIRQVTDDLRPPALDDLGLAGAVEVLAAGVRTPALDVQVEVPDLPPLGAAVEVACYRIAAEALANVVKHAGARRVVVAVHLDAAELVLEVADDGTGLPPAFGEQGLGLGSMRARAEEIGGSFAIASSRPGRSSRSGSPGRPRRDAPPAGRRPPPLLDGVRAALTGAADLEVVGAALNAEDAVSLAATLEPDVVMMDLNLPDGSGLDATKAILRSRPGTRVLVVTMSSDDGAVVAALRAGARGYVVKGCSRADLLQAVRTVASGASLLSAEVADLLGRYVGPGGAAPAEEAFPQLTDREREVLALLARGYDNRRIARELFLADKTVRNHVSNVMGKLGVDERSEAVDRARAAGLGA